MIRLISPKVYKDSNYPIKFPNNLNGTQLEYLYMLNIRLVSFTNHLFALKDDRSLMSNFRETILLFNSSLISAENGDADAQTHCFGLGKINTRVYFLSFVALSVTLSSFHDIFPGIIFCTGTKAFHILQESHFVGSLNFHFSSCFFKYSKVDHLSFLSTLVRIAFSRKGCSCILTQGCDFKEI